MDTHVGNPRSDRTYRFDAARTVELGLLSFMLRVFNTMAGGLAPARHPA